MNQSHQLTFLKNFPLTLPNLWKNPTLRNHNDLLRSVLRNLWKEKTTELREWVTSRYLTNYIAQCLLENSIIRALQLMV